jgi:N utilization substance protein A
MNKSNLDAHIIDAVNIISNDNGVNREDVFLAIENAFVLGAHRKYGNTANLIAKCDRLNGRIKLFRAMNIVENVENLSTDIDLSRALKINKSATIGNTLEEELPCEFDRNIIQKISGTIFTSLKEQKKEQEYEMFKDRVGTLISGTVKSISPREITVWIGAGSVEAKLDPRALMPNEKLSIGDHITAAISEVRKDMRAPQIILSRKDENFLMGLLRQEIPEINEELIQITKIAREAGHRSKIVVSSSDSRLDPVGACVGGRGSRIQSIMKQLPGEKIDIIEHTNDLETLIYRSITPAKPIQVIVHHDKKLVEVIVDELNFSLAIGKRGQNVRLVAKLTDYTIDIMLESQRQEKTAQRFNEAAEKISSALNLDEIVGQVLVASGYSKISDIAAASISSIGSIEGFDDEVAEVLIARSIEFVNKTNEYQDAKIRDLGIKNELLDMPILTKEMIIKLGEAEVFSIADIADLCDEEVIEIIGDDISKYEAGELVMLARKYAYNIE